ncbi:hypothetical protein [Actinoplanes sp. URMC 104]|uniref:hypothetical protein n=1 Tax=Actinoplanes sp. URMC 104 TaxID=3423409 RepID=UPI003F1AD310
MTIDLALWATRALLPLFAATADGVATPMIVGLVVGASAAYSAVRLILGPVWAFVQAVFANHFGDFLVERFPSLNRVLRPGAPRKAGARIEMRRETPDGTVIVVRADDVATVREILRHLPSPGDRP